MPDRFRIRKLTPADPEWDADFPWLLEYPDGFSAEPNDGSQTQTFADAVRDFIWCSQRQCPMCGRGAVVDVDWGWKCHACGTYDVAVGCKRPA